jgi:uncharacterized C2H2 Zn-finger protein
MKIKKRAIFGGILFKCPYCDMEMVIDKKMVDEGFK